MQFRTAAFGRADQATRTVPVTIATVTPVNRGQYLEVLDLRPGAVDLARDPLPLIEGHDTSRVNIGVVRDLVADGERLRGVAVFGTSQRAAELFNDVQAGIVRSVSIGYELLDQGLPVDLPAGAARRFRIRPYEASIVAVPADPRAGFYRSHKDNNTMQTEPTSAAAPAAPASDSPRTRDTKRVAALTSLYLGHQRCLRPEDLQRAVTDGTSEDQFKDLIWSRVESRHTDTSAPPPLREYERDAGTGRHYSLQRALRALVDPKAMRDAGFEADVGRDLEKRSGLNAEGLVVPWDALVPQTRALSVGTPTAGGNLVETQLMGDQFIEALRVRAALMALGARFLRGLVGNIDIPRKTATSSAAWLTETGTASSTDPAVDKVTLSPKRIGAYTDASKQLLLQGAPDVENMLRRDLTDTIAIEFDRVGFSGTGASNQPRGIVNTAGIGAVVGGTNGLAINWGHIVDLEAAAANANAMVDGMTTGYAVNTKTRAWLKKTLKAANLQPIWPDAPLAADGLERLNGYRAAVTNQLRSNLTKGTSNGVCSELVFGNFNDLVLGLWGGGVDLVVDPYTLATTGQVRITANLFADVAVLRPASFAVMADGLTA